MFVNWLLAASNLPSKSSGSWSSTLPDVSAGSQDTPWISILLVRHPHFPSFTSVAQCTRVPWAVSRHRGCAAPAGEMGRCPGSSSSHPGDPGLARVCPGTGMLRGHFSEGSAASHQHGGSTLHVEQVHTVLEASKRIHLSMYVYMHKQIRSQTKHYKCPVKK